MWTTIVIITCIGCFLLYNQIVGLDNKVKSAWSDIEVQLKRRHDLIPNLVEIVKSYSEYEQQTLEEIITLRNKSSQLNNVSERSRVEEAIGKDVKQLLALVENYPNLKADERFADLHRSLINIENDLQFARRYYNGSVRDYNTKIESFPALVLSKPLGFNLADFFEVEHASEKRTPSVNV